MGAAPTLRAVAPGSTAHAPTRRRRAPVAAAPTRRSRASVAVFWVAVVFVVLFAAAAIQIRLISGQRQLDRLEQQISDARTRQDSLRQEEANLRSPAQISQIAADQLGMVHAAPPVMVRPADPAIGSATAQSLPPEAASLVSTTDSGNVTETAGGAD